MQIEIQKDTSEKLEKAARLLGQKKNELANRAILLYLDNIIKHAALKKEMKGWDFLSDEALANFEKAL
ncbi:hypothetical protein HYY73_04670 [Candidatus Woesearchaeota archaeon]|nr:hypothetical protein [Candidatus Woesearchaeota archaeon]